MLLYTFSTGELYTSLKRRFIVILLVLGSPELLEIRVPHYGNISIIPTLLLLLIADNRE